MVELMNGLIRKIVIGKDPKNGMAYFVGMRAGDKNVSAISNGQRASHYKYGTRADT